MIEKINFLEREFLVFTYRKLAYGGVGFFAFFLLLYGILFFREHWVETRTERLTEEVLQLKEKKEKILMAVAEQRQMGGSVEGAIYKSLEEYPPWSRVLRELTRLLPSDLWLVSLKSYQKSQTGSSTGLILSGEARDAGSISIFLDALQRSDYFVQPVLSDSKEETRGVGKIYVLTIDTGIAPLVWEEER